MTIRASIVAVLACATLVAGCGAKTPDYQSVWTTSTTPSATPTSNPIPIGTYLRDQGVHVEQVASVSQSDLTVSIPTPKGWTKRDNPKPPSGTEVIAKGSPKGDPLPRAIVTVLKLTGDFDAGEAVKNDLANAEQTPSFQRLDSSLADFNGFPSAMIQGIHSADGQPVHTWLRMVIATGSPPANQRYLIQLTIVTRNDKAAAEAADVEAIMKGFTVAAK